MMNFKTELIFIYNPVIFDLDGTLLNTLGDLAQAGNYALSKLNFPVHEEKEYKLFVGNGIPKLIERILPKNFSERDFSEAYRLFSEYYAVHSADKTAAYDNITELLDELSARNITCLCNTNKSHEFAEVLLNRFFGGRIKEVIGGEHGYPKKPAPEAARYLADKYKTEGCFPIYVGDSSVDMQTAANAGIAACGVLWGFRAKEELLGCNPRFIAENVSELRDIILNNI